MKRIKLILCSSFRAKLAKQRTIKLFSQKYFSWFFICLPLCSVCSSVRSLDLSGKLLWVTKILIYETITEHCLCKYIDFAHYYYYFIIFFYYILLLLVIISLLLVNNTNLNIITYFPDLYLYLFFVFSSFLSDFLEVSIGY